MNKKIGLVVFLLVGLLLVSACQGATGPQGLQGPAGEPGPPGPPGPGLTEEQAQTLEAVGALAEAIPYPGLEEVRRGCPACHVLVDEETGKYTLAYEAHERAEVRGVHHPEVAPDGTSLEHTEEVNVTTCLQCHAAGTGTREGKGTVAPLMLRLMSMKRACPIQIDYPYQVPLKYASKNSEKGLSHQVDLG